MAIDSHTVRRIAALACLDIPDETVGLRANEMATLVASLGTLGEVEDLDTISPNPVPRRLDEERAPPLESFPDPNRVVDPSGALVVPPMKKPR